jgi:hypothetical protein
MKTLRFLMVACVASLALVGTASAQQWVWKDASGNRVFSDKAPPPGIPESSIIKRPGGNAVRVVPVRPESKSTGQLVDATRVAAAASAAAAASGASAPRRSASAAMDPELVKRKQAQEAAAKASEAAQQDKIAKAKAENCSRARQAERDLTSGTRVSRTNAKGEREIMNEQQLAVELAAVRGSVKENCN